MSDQMGTYFLYLVAFRYLRMVGLLYGAIWKHRVTPVPERPNVRPTDCTVILPTSDPRRNPDFEECLNSCLANKPSTIIIVTNSSALVEATKPIVAPYEQRFPHTNINVKSCHYSEATKRQQIAYGLGHVKTKVTVFLDEHVFWPSPRFLPALIAPFNNEEGKVGLVGTKKRGRRSETGLSSFWNMLGAIYLERQNFELHTTNALDGGVVAVSSLTSAHRSTIITNCRFRDAFVDQCYLFGKFEADDGDIDAFITRWNIKEGFKVKIQHSADTCIETTVSSTFGGLLSQIVVEYRSTWRNHCAAVFTFCTFFKQPVCTWKVYLIWFINFTAFNDIAQIYTLRNSRLGLEPNALTYLIYVMLVSKVIKIAPYFFRHPSDILFLLPYLVFTYLQSLLKLYAGLTFFFTNSGPDRYAEAEAEAAAAAASLRPFGRPKPVPPRPHQSPYQPVPASSYLKPPRATHRNLAGADRVARAVREDAPSPVSPAVFRARPAQRAPTSAPAPSPAPAPKKRGRPRQTPNLDQDEWGASPNPTPKTTPKGSPALKGGAKRGRGRPRKNPL
ncbi:hypothetical protein BDW74DRAFT_166387 [Aspergillus multicolor]|uniref:uncharacterized protein n=1 Tax=Aspergillus multicolor TaxID=41759 RepID=UPI003CCD8205